MILPDEVLDNIAEDAMEYRREKRSRRYERVLLAVYSLWIGVSAAALAIGFTYGFLDVTGMVGFLLGVLLFLQHVTACRLRANCAALVRQNRKLFEMNTDLFRSNNELYHLNGRLRRWAGLSDDV